MVFKKALENFLHRFKGKNYTLDPNIPLQYLIWLVYARGIMWLRGKLSFVLNDGSLFIGKSVTIICRRRIDLGRGVTVDDDCLINALSENGVTFGDNVSMGKRTVIECSGSLNKLGKGIKVGNNVGLGRDCFYGCAGGIIIGDNTIVGNFVSFHSENHNFSRRDIPIKEQGVNQKGIVIGEDCWIGAKATILDNVVLKEGCIITAGAVVTAGIYEPYGIYGGIPAKLIKIRP